MLLAVIAASAWITATASSAFAAGDANVANCANEAVAGFRTYLPDCRAYELVSPPFKEGFAPESVLATSADGERLVLKSVGTFAEAGSNPLGAYYEAVRSSSGWQTTSITPPAQIFNASAFFTANADLSESLWSLRSANESIYAANLYRRQASGAFVKVGSMAPPSTVSGPPAESFQVVPVKYEYAGASRDLSHALFMIVGGPFWAGDTTREEGSNRSLYQYVGLGNKAPELVGVSDGKTIVDREQLAVGQPISNCATTLGSAEGTDTYNAVSRTGDTIFFTAQTRTACAHATRPDVNELYARIDGFETVAISEPTTAQCGRCNTSDPASATFQGASEDGSQAFFLTEQELLPGLTGRNLYEYDFDAPKENKIVAVSNSSAPAQVQGVARVSQDGSHVYFVAKGLLTEGPNAEGDEPVAGGDNLYVFERGAANPAGRTSFVATLSEEDQELWEAEDGRPVQATPNGRFLVFLSFADLTPGDTSLARQVFEYDAATGTLVRISRGQNGYPGGDASADSHSSTIRRQFYLARTVPAEPATNNLAVSNDGTTVVFESKAGLTPASVTAEGFGARSAYEHRSSGDIGNGDVYLLSSGTNQLSTELLRVDTTGANVSFAISQPLLAVDGDTQFDIYDAREAGGFLESSARACQGEACQGLPTGPPSLTVPDSVQILGAPPVTSVVSSTSNVPKVAPPKRLSRADRLAKALRACKGRLGRKRKVCERQARRRFGTRRNGVLRRVRRD